MYLWLLVNIILTLLASYIIYNTTLSFLGLYIPFLKSSFPIFLFALPIYISKFIFEAPPVMHTIMLVCICTILIYIFNNFSFIISLSVSLLTLIIIIIGSILIVCPLLVKFGFNLSIVNFKTINWVVLNIAELVAPTFVMILNKSKKFSIINQIVNR